MRLGRGIPGPVMADMSGLVTHLQVWAEAAVIDALQRTQEDTFAAAPIRTGALRGAISTTTPQSDGSTIRAEIRADMPYAGYTDTGTQPHMIFPVRAKMLAFYWERMGKFVFFRWVNHPGTKGTQWFNSGIDGGEPMLSRWHDNLEISAAVGH